MALLNAEKVFTSKKQLSRPIKKVPGKVKDTLNICRAYEDGIFQIEDMEGMALYDRCYVFEDVNYINQDDGKKEEMLLNLMKCFKALNTQWKMTIANEQMDLDEFLAGIYRPIHGEEYQEIGEWIGEWVNEKVKEGSRDLNRVMYLTVTCRSRTHEEACMYFATLDTTLQMVFGALGSRLYRMSGRERLAALQRIFQMGSPQIPYGGGMEDGEGGPGKGRHHDAWKNHILPPSIRQNKSCLELGDRYVSVLFGHSYAASLNEGKVLHDLVNIPYPVYVTLDVEPVDKKVLTDKLVAAHVNTEKAINEEMDRKKALGQYGGVSYRKSKRKDEIEDYIDQMESNDEQGAFIGLLVAATADSLGELQKRVESLKAIASSNNFTLDTYNYRQLKALSTALPIGGRQVDNMRFFLSSSQVAFNPYYAHDLADENGYCYGLNRVTKRLLRGNRKLLANPHGIIVSHTGGGKSFLIKATEVSQTLLLTDDDVIIIDPQNEFRECIDDFSGQYFDFTPKCGIYLNPYEIPEDTWMGGDLEREKFIAVKSEYCVSFCTAAMRNITVTQEHAAAVGRAVRLVYEKAFAEKRLKHQPTLRDIYGELTRQAEETNSEYEKRNLSQILNSLEEYTYGSYDMFAHESNMDIHNRLCGFGLKNVPEGIWEPVMVTLMHFLSERLEHNQGPRIATHLIVDETQVVCSRKSSAMQLLRAVETYRKFGGIVTMAIQNLTRAMEIPELRDMFSNCSYKCFFDQGGIDAAMLQQIQELSAAEAKSLSEDMPGRGVMVWGKKVLLFDAVMAKENPLYEKFSTNFHEKAQAGGEA